MDPAIDVTELARSSVDLIKDVGPAALALALVATLPGLLGRSGRTELRLALRGLVGGRRPRPRQLALGLAIPLLAVSSLSITFALEQELRNGPNRMVGTVAGPGAQDASWLLQKGTNHFMNDSRLPGRLAVGARLTPGSVTLWSELTDVVEADGDRSTSLLIARARGAGDRGVPFAVDEETARCAAPGARCTLGEGEAIVDEDLARPGGLLQVRGQTLRVVGNFADPASLLNRAVVAVHASAFDRPGGSRERPYAVIAPNELSGSMLARQVAGHTERDAVQVRSSASIRAANATFWAGNGTPLMLILVLIIMAFGSIAYFAARRGAQEQAKPALATLLALGVAPGVLARAELARALLSTLIAGVVALPIAHVVVELANSQILGFHAEVTLTMVLASMGLMVVVAATTALLLYTRVRALDVPRAMNA